MTLIKFLSDCGFFVGLSEAALHTIALAGFQRTLKKREVLFVEGDPGHSIYFLLNGVIQLHRSATDGTEVVLKIVQPGESFAEAVLFERSAFPATATALSDSEIFMLPRREVHRLLESKEFRDDFIAMLLSRQRYLAERIVFLSRYDVEERFFRFLDDQFDGAKVIELPFSKKDLASAIGTSAESLSRLITRLEQAGEIKWEQNTIEIIKEPWWRG